MLIRGNKKGREGKWKGKECRCSYAHIRQTDAKTNTAIKNKEEHHITDKGEIQ